MNKFARAGVLTSHMIVFVFVFVKSKCHCTAKPSQVLGPVLHTSYTSDVKNLHIEGPGEPRVVCDEYPTHFIYY